MAKDLKLTAVLVDNVSSGLKKAAADWKAIVEAPAQKTLQVQERTNKKIIDNDEKLERERIKLQRASAALANRQEAQTLSSQMRASDKSLTVSKSNAEAALRIQRQASIAESSLILDKFDRRIAIERTRHSQILQDIKKNDAAVEAEIKRHNAVVSRIQMDKGNFSNTPFQSLLGQLSKVTGMMGVSLPASIQTASTSMSGLGGVSAGAAIGMAAVGAASVAAAAGLAYSYGEAEESFLANKKLDIVLKSTGNTIGYTRQQLIAMADQMQKTTNYSDEMVISAETILLRYDAIGKDTFPRVLKAAADLGAETGDMAGAARDLGMALQVPDEAGRKLTSMGIKLSESQKKIIQDFADVGNKAEAQAYILGLVEKSYGGAAEGMSRNTVKLKNQVGELAEIIGGPLVTAANAGAGAMLSFLKVLSLDNNKSNDFYKSQIEGLTGVALASDKVNKSAKAIKIPDFGKNDRFKQDAEAAQKPKTEKIVQEQIKFNAENKSRIKKETEDLALAQMAAEVDAENTALASKRERRAKLKEKEHAQYLMDEKEALDKRIAADRATAGSSVKLSQAQAQGDPIAEMKLRQGLELNAVQGNEAAITNIKRAHEIERRKLILDTSRSTVASISGNLATIAGQYKSFSGVAKKAAQAQNTMDTYAGATAAYKSAAAIPYVGFIMAPIAAGAAIAAGLANASKINSQNYATGTDYAPGGRALVGERGPEYVDLPKGSKVHTANDTSRMIASNNITAPITINISGNADDRTVRAMGETIEQKLKQHAWLTKEVAYRGVTA